MLRYDTGSAGRVLAPPVDNAGRREAIEDARQDKKSEASRDISLKTENSASISATLCLKACKGRAF